MIINIEQRKGSLIVSYVNKAGDVACMQLNIPANQQYEYEAANYSSPDLQHIRTWNNKPVKRRSCEFLSKNRIQELFIDAGDIVNPLFERNTPKLFSCDIEVDVTDDGFSDAKDANNRINTIAWCRYPDVYVFGLKPLSGEECASIEKRINEHIKILNLKYSFVYKQHDNEANMLHDFLYNYARLAPLITGWNFWNYDWRYIYNRCKRLNLDISWMSPTKQWFKHRIMDKGGRAEIMLPQHKLIVDYLEIYKKWDRTIDPKENNTLDFVSEAALGIKKVKYSGGFKELYEKDFDKYVFYNAVDTILVEGIHNKLKTMSTFLGLGTITRVEAMNAFSPIQMLESALVKFAYEKNQVFPKNKQDNVRESYEGAFVFDPIPNMYKWVTSWDFAALYPTLMRQFKISIENLVTKDKNHINKPHEIKCISGAVFDNSKEPLLPAILTSFYKQRKDAKKIYMQAEKEIGELQAILKQRKAKSII